MTFRTLGAALAALSIAMVSACDSAGGRDASHGDRVEVAAAFYPLQYAAEQIGGEHVTVTGLTKPGGEPHDLELTPRDIARLSQAKVVVYEKHFQPAVDDAVAEQAKETGFDVSEAASLSLKAAKDDGHGHGTETQGTETHAAEGPAQDPHFWLDPVRYASVATAIGERLAKADPAHASDYTANAKTFAARLSELDGEFKAGLAGCASKDLVTGHVAFAYLADRYGLHQEGISGISPDAEPDAAAMKEIAAHIREHGVKTVYAETLVSPDLANTIAKETGAKVAVLDPIEGITDASKGKDYFGVMRSNLDALKSGQSCP